MGVSGIMWPRIESCTVTRILLDLQGGTFVTHFVGMRCSLKCGTKCEMV